MRYTLLGLKDKLDNTKFWEQQFSISPNRGYSLHQNNIFNRLYYMTEANKVEDNIVEVHYIFYRKRNKYFCKPYTRNGYIAKEVEVSIKEIHFLINTVFEFKNHFNYGGNVWNVCLGKYLFNYLSYINYAGLLKQFLGVR